MKLIFCDICDDVFKLTKDIRYCQCKRCSGRYIDDINAEYTNGIPIGFDNFSLGAAVQAQPIAGLGKKFEAFVIPKNVKTMTKINSDDWSSRT